MFVLQVLMLLELIKLASPLPDDDVQHAMAGCSHTLTLRKCLRESDRFTLKRSDGSIICRETACHDETYKMEYNDSGCLSFVIQDPKPQHNTLHSLEFSRKIQALTVRLHVEGPEDDTAPRRCDTRYPSAMSDSAAGYIGDHYGLIKVAVISALGAIMCLP